MWSPCLSARLTLIAVPALGATRTCKPSGDRQGGQALPPRLGTHTRGGGGLHSGVQRSYIVVQNGESLPVSTSDAYGCTCLMGPDQDLQVFGRELDP